MNAPRQTGKGNPHGALSTLMAAAFVFAILSLAPLGNRAVFGQCQYEITHSIIQGPPCWPSGNPATIIPRAMNSMGHVVGLVSDCLNPSKSYGFLWIEGVMTVFEHPEGVTDVHHLAINDDGVITGVHLFPGQGYTGFAYDPHTQTYHYLLPVHDGAEAHTRSIANSVNNQGVIAGSRIVGKPGDLPMPSNAVIWRPFEKGSPVEDLGDMGVGFNSTASDISELNDVTGWIGSSPAVTGWMMIDGELSVLPNPKGSLGAAAVAINLRGQLAGGANMPLAVPMIWEDGQWEFIDMLSYCQAASALAINDISQMGGLCVTPTGAQLGFLWQNGNVFDLNNLADAPGVIGRVQAMNNAGQVLVRYSNGRGLLLTPTGVPVGDLNYDCRVDFHDLLIMFEQWGQVPQDAPKGRGPHGAPSADLNGDGVVNVTDLLILFDNWSP